jgi:hypothetical protein
MMKINSGGTTISVSQAIAVRTQSSHSLHMVFRPIATVTQIRDRLPVSESPCRQSLDEIRVRQLACNGCTRNR